MNEKRQENNMDELMTLAYAAQEFRIHHRTLNTWIRLKKLPARLEHTELGQKYYLIRRADLEQLLQTRSTFGRPLKRT